MSILKVEVGSPVTLHIAGAEEVEGQYGPQIQFTADNGDRLFVGKDTALRQLGRIGFTPETSVGQSLHFEKVQKGNKTFLNINPAPRSNGAQSGAKTAATVSNGAGKNGGASGGSATPVGRVALARRPLVPLYEECLSAAKAAVQKELGKAATTADVMAGAATLFIQATRNDAPLHAVAAKSQSPDDDSDSWTDHDLGEHDLPF